MPGSGGGAPTTTAGSGPTPTNGGGGGSSLHDKFKARGKLFFGTEIDHYHLNNNPLITIVKNSFGQVTAENSMKWDAIEREYLPILSFSPVSLNPLPPKSPLYKNLFQRCPPLDPQAPIHPRPLLPRACATPSAPGVHLSLRWAGWGTLPKSARLCSVPCDAESDTRVLPFEKDQVKEANLCIFTLFY